MQTFLAIFSGKLIAQVSRFLKIGGGSAAPGLYALKIDPELVLKLSKKIPWNVVITGTNGKTTTARMISHFAKQSGLRVIKNATGSNLERGIASALISHSGDLDLGIWELDEFAFNSVTPKLKPDIVIFLNVSRDQLDRYGEIDKVVNRWCDTVSKLDPKTTVLINSDDPNLAKLKKYFTGKVKEFGKKNIKNIKTKGLNGSSFDFTINDIRYPINLPIPGLYHIYDAVAAIACAYHLGLPVRQLTKKLIDFSPAFGRFEKLPFGFIFLIKNPAGATQVFETIAPQIKPEDRLLIALNDNLADGTDVSWIWDANFEKLLTDPRHKTVQKSAGVNINPPRGWTMICSGSRAYDLAVRLKYAGFEPKKLIVVPSLEKALREATVGLKGSLFILPTYTALLELQRILAKQGIKPHYWQEN